MGARGQSRDPGAGVAQASYDHGLLGNLEWHVSVNTVLLFDIVHRKDEVTKC